MTTNQPLEFSRTVPLARIERKHQKHKLEATDEECAALAARFNLVSLERLEAECEIWRDRADVFYIKGIIEAELTQECVVTFDPVPATLSEEFHEKLCMAGYVPEEGEEELEEIQGTELDMGEVVAQYLYLSLNQYPRAPLVE